MIDNKMKLRLVSITPEPKSILPYLKDDFCIQVFKTYERYYPVVGFDPPWIGYFALRENKVVGVGGYKGPPKNGKVEIAYGTVPGNEGQGIATEICRRLTLLATEEAPDINITARTLRIENASTSILRKNGYQLLGTVNDPEDGLVWEWKKMFD